MKTGIIAVPALILASQPATAQPWGSAWCRSHAERVAVCRQIRSRLTAYNGNPAFRIGVLGSNRLLGVVGRGSQDTEDGGMLPANVRAALGDRPFDARVFGRFEVCPLTRQRAGWMQMVCVVSRRNLFVRRR